MSETSVTQKATSNLPDAYIIREFTTPRQAGTAPGRIVLHNYVTGQASNYALHWQNLDDGGLYYGEYLDTNIQHAHLRFERRVRAWLERFSVKYVPVTEKPVNS